MKKLYSSENKIVIYLLQSKLAEQGISCFLKNENPPLAGEIPPVVALPELWVINDNCYTQAMNIIENELNNLTTPKQHWQCPQCGENLEGQFEICWKCGASKLKDM